MHWHISRLLCNVMDSYENVSTRRIDDEESTELKDEKRGHLDRNVTTFDLIPIFQISGLALIKAHVGQSE